jgi:hypothetical protein
MVRRGPRSQRWVENRWPAFGSAGCVGTVKTNFPNRTPSGSRPATPRMPAPSVTRPSGQSLPFAVAATASRPLPRRQTSTGLADELKTLAPQASLRGEHGRALELYQRLCSIEPTVPLHRIRAGDCFVKLGKKREALVEYRIAAGAYVALGMQVHARSAWRLVLGIVPGDADATAHLKALDARARGARPGTPPPVPPGGGAIPAPPAPAGGPSLRRSRGSSTPTAPESEVRAERELARALETNAETERVMRHAVLALEFADLDEDEDRIWLDLTDACGPAEADALPELLVLEDSGEPVAFFAETSDVGPVRPESVLGAGPRASLIEEQTKPVPPPDEE